MELAVNVIITFNELFSIKQSFKKNLRQTVGPFVKHKNGL